MKFSAYMFIRNGIRAGYTFMEAIENVLPFVDEFFILEGQSNDGTLEALELFSKWNPKIIIESKLPQYVQADKDEKGLLLGTAFEEARRKCDGDWLVQVQADTVFHPITILAARYFLMQLKNAEKYDAIKVLRYQYRWNWQEMYRKDYLNLIFKKSSGVVFGDAIDVEVKGKISKKLLSLFKHFPIADNAWIFWENIMGKIKGCYEIWESHDENIKSMDFAWYNDATGRSFKEDLKTYSETGSPPPFWQTKTIPFKNMLPENLWVLIGKCRYEIAPRFMNKDEVYHSILNDLLVMINRINSIISPIGQFMKIWK
jgi:hypothetical protein